MFDGEGFVRGVLRKGRKLATARVLVGQWRRWLSDRRFLCQAAVAEIALFDAHQAVMHDLAARIRACYPDLKVTVGSNDPAGFDIVVHATPLGMKAGDPLPMDVARNLVLGAGRRGRDERGDHAVPGGGARGCEVQVGTDMLFEQIPAYLAFFGFGTATADELREIARIRY